VVSGPPGQAGCQFRRGESGDSCYHIEHQPIWASRALAELTQNIHPVVRLKELIRNPTPKAFGGFLGQYIVNLYAATEAWEKSLAKLQNDPAAAHKLIEKLAAAMAQKPRNPIVDSMTKVSEALEWAVERSPQEIDWFQAYLLEVFRVVVDQPDLADIAGFFSGFARGLNTPGLKEGRPRRDKATSNIYSLIALHWREIETLPNLPALEEFLTRHGVKPQSQENLKRLEKLCQRIGLKLGKRGRPKKARKSDAPTS
jgi:hypothetical protein